MSNAVEESDYASRRHCQVTTTRLKCLNAESSFEQDHYAPTAADGLAWVYRVFDFKTIDANLWSTPCLRLASEDLSSSGVRWAVRLPLGVPAQLVMAAMDLSARLVGSPQSRGAAGQAAEREAGYVLLGALVLALPPASVATQRAELLELWRVALAPAAAAELDLKKYMQAGPSLACLRVAHHSVEVAQSKYTFAHLRRIRNWLLSDRCCARCTQSALAPAAV